MLGAMAILSGIVAGVCATRGHVKIETLELSGPARSALVRGRRILSPERAKEERRRFLAVWTSLMGRVESDAWSGVVYADVLVTSLFSASWVELPTDGGTDGWLWLEYDHAHRITLRSARGDANLGELTRAMGFYSHIAERLLPAPRTGPDAHARGVCGR
jgi:hypothetical protein